MALPLPRKRRLWVRVVSVLCALMAMYLYSTVARQRSSPTVYIGERKSRINLDMSRSRRTLLQSSAIVEMPHLKSPADFLSIISRVSETPSGKGRHLLSTEVGNLDNCLEHGGTSGGDNDNCSSPRFPPPQFNNSCDYIREECSSNVQLINYLSFVLCDLHRVQPLGYVILGLWLIYLISLLATTADNFFVPPLNLLSEKLRLSPSIAGITLLAIGNGAPDVFTAYASLKIKEPRGHEMALVLGALIGASIFISTIVLGTIILITKVTSKNIDKFDFVRDVLAYMCVVALVAGVVSDGDVHLGEAIAFPLFYIAYIVIVVALGYVRRWLTNRSKRRYKDSEKDPLLDEESVNVTEDDTAELSNEISESLGIKKKESGPRIVLLGLTWPYGSNIAVKFQWLVELPFSILRWLSVPPCCYDGQWTQWHHWFAVVSPVPMAMVLLVTVSGWDGFSIHVGKLPLFGFLIIIGVALTLLLYFLLSSSKPPHWSMQIVLGTAAFVMSIAWLNLEANEVVSLLNAFGLLFTIDNAILGLTVLAIGNSVGDWVADTAVARAGKPGMGVASCFGSPLLNDVLGLSVALLARIAVYDHGKTFCFAIGDPVFDKVKLSWIFLGISLLASAVIFPLFKFSPPKAFGVILIYIYIVFMIFSILDATGVMPIRFG